MSDLVFDAPDGVRLHFNRHGAAPLVWCIATDDFEIAVRDFVVLNGADIKTVYKPKATPDDEDGKPSAWLETCGPVRIIIAFGTAHIEPLPRSAL